MPQPVKVLEIGPEAWMEGMSLHPTLAVGGIFRQATNFDPFARLGVLRPTQESNQQGANTVTTAGLFNVGFSTGGLPYFYSFGNGTKVFQVATLTGTVTDVSAQITDIATVRGATKFKNRIVYASETSIKANSIPLVKASQVGLLSVTTGGVHILKVGPDRNLYVTNLNSVGRITSVAGLPGNSGTYLTFEDDVIVRDLENDGKYLVILGDTANTLNDPASKVRCFVAFWNMKSQDLTQIWEFEDNITYGMKFTGEEIVVFGRDNIYTCSVSSPLRPIMSTRGQSVFANIAPTSGPGAIIARDGSVLWGSSGQIYGFGRPNQALKKIFYNPFGLSDGNVSSLFADGIGVWAMGSTNKLWDFHLGGTLTTATILLSDIDFRKPYRFAFAKIITTSALASGESVSLQINTQSGNKLVLNSNGMTFTDDGAVSSKIVYPEAGESVADTTLFEDLTNISISSVKKTVRRVEIWAYPAPENQSLGY